MEDVLHFEYHFQYLSPSSGFFFYEMLIEIGMDAFDFVALLIGQGLRIDISIGGCQWYWHHWFWHLMTFSTYDGPQL